MKILVPDSIDLDLQVPQGVHAHIYAVDRPIEEEHRDAEALVLWSNPGQQLRRLAQDLPNLRWVQGLMAGMDAAVSAGFADDVVFTSGVGLHDGPVAEHTLALILAAARRLDRAVLAQKDTIWDGVHIGGNQAKRTEHFSTLHGAKAVIWGFGSIGQHLAPWLTVLGASVTGVASTAGERAGYPVITPAELPELLPQTDVLVNILPSLPGTQKIVDAAIFEALPPHAWFFNVGRGATVDQRALTTALTSGQIAGAGIDVTEPEPLPADDPLWHAPNLILTPHSAGGRPRGSGERIEENLRRYLAGEELAGLVAR